MICHRFRTIFVHVPKTAGQSIERVFLEKMDLAPEDRGQLLLRENADPALGPPRLAHLYASEYVSCGYIAQSDFDAYFKFAVVRNPWARMVSEYKFAAGQTDISFADFLSTDWPPQGWSDYSRHIEPQWKFVCDTDRNLIVDQVIRYETLAKELGPLFTRIFSEAAAMGWWNAALDRRDYRSFYDSQTRALVEDIYRDDIELFQYAFD
jgi:hypothetical protein